MTRRAALYAGHSSDNQNPRSTADQLSLLREYAANDGLTVIGEFADEANSGSSIASRPGLQARIL